MKKVKEIFSKNELYEITYDFYPENIRKQMENKNISDFLDELKNKRNFYQKEILRDIDQISLIDRKIIKVEKKINEIL